MNSLLPQILILFLSFYIANAQWRGDIGYQRTGRNWELRGGARYEINRGRTRGNVGGHGFINSNGQRGWGVSGGVKRTFAGGRGSYGVQGFRNSNGNYGARATLSYRWGRRRRSISDDYEMKKICAECVTIETITSGKKLQEYTDIHNVQFGMVARFKRFYQGENETVLSFKIKQIIEAPPAAFNISEAKVFNIFADTSSCALICLKDVIHKNYLVTGAMFHGRLIIHDKLLLLHVLNQGRHPVVEKDASDNDDEADSDADKRDDPEDDDNTNEEKEEGDQEGAHR